MAKIPKRPNAKKRKELEERAHRTADPTLLSMWSEVLHARADAEQISEMRRTIKDQGEQIEGLRARLDAATEDAVSFQLEAIGTHLEEMRDRLHDCARDDDDVATIANQDYRVIEQPRWTRLVAAILDVLRASVESAE